MTLKKLSLGYQNFADLIQDNCLYVDKTKFIYQLLTEGKAYFMSRPRRFGKSLLISTLEAIFQNKRELFNDLWIAGSAYSWQSYPIIRLDMSLLNSTNLNAMQESLMLVLKRVAEKYGCALNSAMSVHDYFSELIIELSKINKVVILIDEYDKPILNHITNLPEANKLKEFLRDFYGIIKSQDAYLKFIFLTGVTKFAKVSVFSGINNLSDITMVNSYANLLGYTDEEIEHYFEPYIQSALSEIDLSKLESYRELKKWYNGYKFSTRGISVYNPYSVLAMLSFRDFRNYWFETGTPSFLIELIQNNNLDVEGFEKLNVKESAFSTYDLDRLEIVPLLYQSGYLTIKQYDPNKRYFQLGYPNYEVKNSFLEILMVAKTRISKSEQSSILFELSSALEKNNMNNFFHSLKQLMAIIPYELHSKGESYYQTIFYLIFTLIGHTIQCEVHTNVGRIDAVIKYQDKVYVFEFKLDTNALEAIEQIKEKQYYLPYMNRHTTLILVGINFSTKERNVTEWQIETIVN